MLNVLLGDSRCDKNKGNDIKNSKKIKFWELKIIILPNFNNLFYKDIKIKHYLIMNYFMLTIIY